MGPSPDGPPARSRAGLPLAISLAVAAAAVAAAAEEGAAEPHHWPRARGHHGGYFLTNETMPQNLSSAFSWSFHNPAGRFTTVMRGSPLFDSQKNVLILTEGALFKLSPEGRVIWAYQVPTKAMMNVNPCLMGDAVFGMAGDSTVYALDLWTGRQLWTARYAKDVGGDTSYVDAHEGLLLTAVENSVLYGGGNLRVLGMNASSGAMLWEMRIERPTWNFSPMFPGDGSFVFMDVVGGVYRVRHRDGKQLWHTPVDPQYLWSFTDGGSTVSPDGRMVITCSHRFGDTTGVLRAYRVEDGVRLWEKLLPTGCTSWPVIAESGDWGVIPAGHFVAKPLVLELPRWMPKTVGLCIHLFSLYMGPDLRRLPFFDGYIRSVHTEVIAFDTATGETRWSFRTPDWQRFAAKGDEEGFLPRVLSGASPICLPTTWGTATLSGDGTLYVGHVSGLLYALGDFNGDGRIDPEKEVSTFDMDAAPLPNSPAFAPGMMAVASCDTMFVFRK
mmetsp:Transcript_117215/g.364991  ORF Transcript_117215/g.364991 Transcript_117215/m.364991 type:complete len:499 (+) Transcript_117215:75-1571(+)